MMMSIQPLQVKYSQLYSWFNKLYQMTGSPKIPIMEEILYPFFMTSRDSSILTKMR